MVWREGDDIKRYNWRAGSLLVPPERWFHQYFNVGGEPARFRDQCGVERRHRLTRRLRCARAVGFLPDNTPSSPDQHHRAGQLVLRNRLLDYRIHLPQART